MSAPDHVPEPITKYRCERCGLVYADSLDAEDCWTNHRMPEIDEVYACPVCLEEHDTEDLACACIASHAGDTPPAPITAAELEAAGQTRLIP